MFRSTAVLIKARSPYCSTEAMSLHLAEYAVVVRLGRHSVLLSEQAGWHLSAALTVPSNITLLPLPPKCPELNVMANVWQFMRDNWLSNRVFATYDDIVAHCREAWNKLIDQPWCNLLQQQQLNQTISLSKSHTEHG